LTDIRAIVELIAATTTTKRLTFQFAYDPDRFPTGQKITKADFKTIPMRLVDWHSEWTMASPQRENAQSNPRQRAPS
jgi:Rhodopirellula transposase DDE domain